MLLLLRVDATTGVIAAPTLVDAAFVVVVVVATRLVGFFFFGPADLLLAERATESRLPPDEDADLVPTAATVASTVGDRFDDSDDPLGAESTTGVRTNDAFPAMPPCTDDACVILLLKRSAREDSARSAAAAAASL